MSQTPAHTPQATIAITVKGQPLGEVVVRFYDDVAPRHVHNFLTLARQGFYDGTTFHRVIPGFMI